jgi:hypothetical protein
VILDAEAMGSASLTHSTSCFRYCAQQFNTGALALMPLRDAHNVTLHTANGKNSRPKCGQGDEANGRLKA